MDTNESSMRDDDSGLYQLIIALPKEYTIKVGHLGCFSFPAGCYVYTGSAQRGLNSRIARHLRKRKRMHWHIDYLLKFGRIIAVNRYKNGSLLECELNRRVEDMHSSKIVAQGFGSSDCKCLSHLVYFERSPKFLKSVSSPELERMSKKKFTLSATVSSDNPTAIKLVLKRLIGANGTIKSISDGFEIQTKLEGVSAKDLNRTLLSEMRRAEKKTRLRAEWSSGDTVQKFFDYVPKGIRKTN
jgi:Uri superfamily endonuclease